MGIPLTGLLAAILHLGEKQTTELYLGVFIILIVVILIVYTKQKKIVKEKIFKIYPILLNIGTYSKI